MAEFKEISEKAKEIIEKFVRINCLRQAVHEGSVTQEFKESWIIKSIFNDVDNLDNINPIFSYDNFVVSLYAMIPDADDRVICELKEYCIDLKETISQEEIEILLNEFGAVIRYCSERDFIWWPSKNLSQLLPVKFIKLCGAVVTDYCRRGVPESNQIFGLIQQIASCPEDGNIKQGICGDVLFPFADDIQFEEILNAGSFDAYEPNPKFWAFGQILNSAYSRGTKIQLGKSSDDPDGKLYDYVFSCPAGRKDIQLVATELYDIASTRLKDNGVMCCILPESFCYAAEWYSLRKILADKSRLYFALVISLPDVLQPYVTENMCLLCLLKVERETVFDNNYIIQMGNDIIKDENGITNDIELREKYIDLQSNIVLMNAKSNDFLLNAQGDIWSMAWYDGEVGCLTPNGLDYYDFMDHNVLEELSECNEYNKKYKHVWKGSFSKLTEDINLMPIWYLINEAYLRRSDDVTYFKLGDIIELVSAGAHKPHQEDDGVCPVDHTRLSIDYLNCDISYKRDSKTRIEGADKEFYSKTFGTMYGPLFFSVCIGNNLENFFGHRSDGLSEKCLLTSYSDGRVKVGKVVDFPRDCPFELSPEVIPFKLKSDVVSEEYLLRCLMSDDVAKQAVMLSWGGFYNSIDPGDFLQIIIPIPSKEEQERICKEEAQERLKETDQELKQAKEKIESDFKKYVEDIHMQKHAIGQTIFDLNNWWSILQLAREKNGGNLNDDTVVGNSVKTKVSEIYDDLSSIISRLQQQIAKMDRGNGLSAEVFPLTEAIEDFIKRHPNALFEYEYNVENHYKTEETIHIKRGKEDSKDEEKKVLERKPKSEEYVKFPRKALTMVLEDIVSNACSHGFVDSSEGNKIRIDFGWVGGYVVATVSNNGKPMSKDMESRVFQYGESSKNDGENSNNGEEHFGLGGYEIKHLMWEFGGDVEISSEPPEGFTVSYKLSFPLADEPVEVANSQSARDLPENVSENWRR